MFQLILVKLNQTKRILPLARIMLLQAVLIYAATGRATIQKKPVVNARRTVAKSKNVGSEFLKDSI